MDTQADISVIKLEALDENVLIDKSDIITIRGVTVNPIVSLGTVNLDIYFRDKTITHTFHMTYTIRFQETEIVDPARCETFRMFHLPDFKKPCYSESRNRKWYFYSNSSYSF